MLPPQATEWAVGGIGSANLMAWWQAGARAFGLGTDLYRPGQGLDETRRRANAVADSVRALVAAAPESNRTATG